MRLLRLAWAAPASLVGLALSPFFERRAVVHGVLLCEGARWPARLGWRYRAMTLGHVVLATGELDPETLAHELAHVRQYEIYGPFTMPLYAAGALAAAARGGHHYRDNPFEVAARRAVAGFSRDGRVPKQMGGRSDRGPTTKGEA